MSTLIFTAGVILGAIVSNIFKLMTSASGTLKIDHSNPKKDKYQICIDDLDIIQRSKRMILKIDHNARLGDSPK